MKTHIIQLERHDDVISTRDKMMWGSSQRILLVFPERGTILTRRVDLVLLQRHSAALGAQLALVTKSASTRQNARELGILVFKSVLQAQKSPWRVPLAIRRKFPRRISQRLQSDDLRRSAQPALQLLIGPRLIIFALGFAAVVALVLFIFPNASVQLVMAEQEQHLSLEIWANPMILSPNLSGGIPAVEISILVEGSEVDNSTGRTILAHRSAVGEVQFTNLTDYDVLVPAGTIVRTQDDPAVRFETLLSVVAKHDLGEEEARTPVRAVLAGSSGNIQAGEITAIEGSVGSLLSVTNPDVASGGTDQFIPSPSNEDYDRVRERLLKKLSRQAEEEMKRSIPPDSFLLIPSLQMKSIVFEEHQPAAGEPADQLEITMKAEFTTWYIKADSIQQAASTALDANLDAGYTPIPDTLKIKLIGPPVAKGSSVGYQIEAFRQLKAAWTKEEVIHLVRGKDLIAAAEVVQENLLLKEPPRFLMSPHWWPRLPYLPFQIEVGVQ